MSSSRPLIGITCYVTQARWGAWDLPTALTPFGYVGCVETAGGRPVLLPPMLEGIEDTLSVLDGLVLVGGPDIDPALYGASLGPHTTDVRPQRDAAELALLQAALDDDLPMLGICRGIQLLNIAQGGTLVQHLPDVVGHEGHRTEPGHFDVHDVATVPGTRTAAVLGERVAVNSAHHQGIAAVGEGLVVSAWADDGSVEALELPDRVFAIGVLWHPEAGDDLRLFDALIAAARDARTGRIAAHGR
jgi:putative glutamine amidotransferase